MYKIIAKRRLQENVNEYVIDAPMVTRNAKPGQFIILRVDENGERVPFTICDIDKENGTITIMVQTMGYTTHKLAQKDAGDSIQDFVGPLGHATDLLEYKKVLMISGGIGCAVLHPQAKFLKSQGKLTDIIVGARNKSLIMYENEFRASCDRLYIMTDDGSYGEKGFVTEKLRELLNTFPERYDAVFAVGPLPMMKAVCNMTREYNLKTIVSLNAVMVDGTGMCGCCRLKVNGELKYACVHGPEFDGHLVDWELAGNRLKHYKALEDEHKCKIR